MYTDIIKINTILVVPRNNGINSLESNINMKLQIQYTYIDIYYFVIYKYIHLIYTFIILYIIMGYTINKY